MAIDEVVGEALAVKLAKEVSKTAPTDVVPYLTMLEEGREWELLLSNAVWLARQPESNLPLPSEVLNYYELLDFGARMVTKAYFAERLTITK